MLLRTQIFALLNVPPVAAVLVAVRKDGDNFRAKINHRLVLIDPWDEDQEEAENSGVQMNDDCWSCVVLVDSGCLARMTPPKEKSRARVDELLA